LSTSQKIRQSRSGIALQTLFFYLVLVWLLVQQASVGTPGSAATLTWAGSLLVGFPLSVYLAYRWSSADGNALGRTGQSLAAAAVAMILPLCALSLSSQFDDDTQVWIDGRDLVPASLIRSLETVDRPEGLRLRIRGLTLSPPPLAAKDAGLMPAELLIDTSLRDGGASHDLLVRAQLLDATDGSVHWSTEYSVDAADTAAIRRVLLKALSEGMSRTCEGSFPSEGQLI